MSPKGRSFRRQSPALRNDQTSIVSINPESRRAVEPHPGKQGGPLLHRFCIPLVHQRHRPQLGMNDSTTWSPGVKFRTPGPSARRCRRLRALRL